ncbi:hypothetical protein HY993_00030 [Candidatus Micrarchaeota archaeon]|nr:hypothetical protein [Candidatus Micrarchaeota archaeon]
MDKINEKQASLALGSLFGLVSLGCGILVYAIPDAAMSLFTSMIHSSLPWQKTVFDAGRFAQGLVAAVVLGLVLGYAFAKLYNYFAKK